MLFEDFELRSKYSENDIIGPLSEFINILPNDLATLFFYSTALKISEPDFKHKVCSIYWILHNRSYDDFINFSSNDSDFEGSSNSLSSVHDILDSETDGEASEDPLITYYALGLHNILKEICEEDTLFQIWSTAFITTYNNAIYKVDSEFYNLLKDKFINIFGIFLNEFEVDVLEDAHYAHANFYIQCFENRDLIISQDRTIGINDLYIICTSAINLIINEWKALSPNSTEKLTEIKAKLTDIINIQAQSGLNRSI